MSQWPNPGEKEKGKAAMAAKGKWAAFYMPHYQVIGSREGQFVGLACRTCNQWDDCHKPDCPVPALECGSFLG